MPRITEFCICIYVFACKLSVFRLCDSDFTPVDDMTIGIIIIIIIIIVVVVVVVVVVVTNLIAVWR